MLEWPEDRHMIEAHLGRLRDVDGWGQKTNNSSGHVDGKETGLGELRRADAGGCNAPKKSAIGHHSGLPEWPEARRKIWLPARNRCPSGKSRGQKSQYCSGYVVGTVTGLDALRRAGAGGCNALKMATVGRRSGLPEWPEDKHMIDAHLGWLRGVEEVGSKNPLLLGLRGWYGDGVGCIAEGRCGRL